MFCKQCGNKLKDDAAFCNHCGAPVAAPSAVRRERPAVAEKEKPKSFTGFSVAGSLLGDEPESRIVPVKAPETPKVPPVAAPRPVAAPGPTGTAPRPVAAPGPTGTAPRPVAAPGPTGTAYRTGAPVDPRVTDWNYSFFDGGLLGLIGVNLLTSFISLITLGFAWPALVCYRLRWVYRHTCIGGYRLRFTGTGLQLFGKFWLWVLLFIVTLTIYGWWIPIRYQQWVTKHVVIDAMIPRERR